MYDIIVFETSLFVCPHENEKPAFSKISTLESVFEKRGKNVGVGINLLLLPLGLLALNYQSPSSTN